PVMSDQTGEAPAARWQLLRGGRALGCCVRRVEEHTHRLCQSTPRVIAAVILDLDGVLVDSEQLWDEARRDLARERGGTWRPDATHAMMGMSSLEWSQYMHDELRVDLTPEEISTAVVERLERLYRERLPLYPGA